MSDTAALLLALQTSVPAAMRALPHWLLWRFETYDGDRKPRKVPYYISGRRRKGGQGGQTDLAELCSFDLVLTHLAHGRYDGAGFAFLPGDGLIGIDIDGAIDLETGEVSARCQAIIDACGSYTEFSPSGRGVHIIVAGECESFRENSIGLEVYSGRQFFTVTGRRWEGTPDQVRPIDAAVLRRLQATRDQARGRGKAPRATAPAPAQPALGRQDAYRRLEAALQHVSPDAYDDWLHAGMALHHALGDAGLRLWDYWSGGSAKYQPGACAEKWASFGNGSHPLTDAWVFKRAIEGGWKPPRIKPPKPHNPATPAPPAQPAGAAPTPSPGCAAPVADDNEPPPPGDDDVPGKARAASWRDELLFAKGSILDCRENVFHILTHHPALAGLVAFDMFSHRILKVGKPPWDSEPGEWKNDDDFELGLWLSSAMGLVIRGEGTLAAGVGMAAYRARFHPVKDWLNSLQWDGIDRLQHWLHDCMGAADTDYHGLVGRLFLMGLVARALHPGCQMDHMIVLEGGQGHGKSSALRILAGEWFADTPIRIGDKDALLNLAGVLLYEVAELDSFNKAEVTAVKQYVSGRVDRVREPYTRRPVDRPRSCVMAGTTNQHEYFKDPTGSRRFWPVAIPDRPPEGSERQEVIDLAKLREWRAQLFAEAVHRVNAGERHYPTRDEEREWIIPEQDKREIADPWFERVAIWLDAPEQHLRREFLGSEILSGALHVPADRIDGARNMATRVGVIMHRLRWEKVRDTTGARLWRYHRPSKAASARAAGEVGVEQGAGGGPSPAFSADAFAGAVDDE